jgi:hypothetical protein
MNTLRKLFIPALGLFGLALPTPAIASPKAESYWRVDDVRPGMKGVGKTVIQGTKIEEFKAEILGVMKDTSPGRDLVLARLSGCNLEKTGVIAGMSGSPVYIEGKLLGAIAYAWAYGKEPIAGITPFCQMHGFVESYERRDVAEEQKPSRIGLAAPLQIDGKTFDNVTVSQDYSDAQPGMSDGLWLQPLRTPLAASGMTPHSLSLLRGKLGHLGLVPMQGGSVGGNVAQNERDVALEPGGALCVAMIQGDFDLSAIGTVTHVEGKRVYGWGHPFMSYGSCEYPLMTGYVHTIYPRLSLSFKMGSPLKTVGIINADVSTCIAGWLDRQPDLLPVRMTVSRTPGGRPKTFNVKVVRQRNMVAPLVYSSLTNSIDMEGELPEEMTANLKTYIEIEGHEPVILNDTYSGSSFSGGRAPQALYNQVSALLTTLLYNSHSPIRISRIECVTEIQAGRRTADIDGVEVETETLAPGETLRANVFLRPYRGLRQRVSLSLPLPKDFPEGTFTATVCDDLTNARAELRDNPTLSNPQSTEQVFESVKVQTAARRTNLVLRLPVSGSGVAVGAKTLPHLPPSMVQILGNSRRSGAQTIATALVAKQPTEWIIQGGDTIRFTVTRNKRTVE